MTNRRASANYKFQLEFSSALAYNSVIQCFREVIDLKALLAMLLSLVMLGSGGDVSNVVMYETASNVYTQEEITSAVDVVLSEFARSWSGCTLTEIGYAGDEALSRNQDYLTRYDAADVLVLLSSFNVDSSGGDGSLEPNSTYKKWSWILVRTSGGDWQLVDHGY